MRLGLVLLVLCLAACPKRADEPGSKAKSAEPRRDRYTSSRRPARDRSAPRDHGRTRHPLGREPLRWMARWIAGATAGGREKIGPLVGRDELAVVRVAARAGFSAGRVGAAETSQNDGRQRVEDRKSARF